MSAAADPSTLIPHEVIALIGFRGCGKSAVGQRLAQWLQWDFVDTDLLVQETAQRTIREIFETDGEREFRKLEAETLEHVLNRRRCVVAAGGGAVLARRNRKALRSTGVCVWLTAPPEELRKRIAADDKTTDERPSLTGQSTLDEIESVLETRLPVYEATADLVVSTCARSVDQVADAVLAALGIARAAAGKQQ